MPGEKMRFLQGFVAALVILFIGAVTVAYSGVYNVAAGAPEIGILQWLLSTTMQRSVKSHAQGLIAPSQLTDQQAHNGFLIYRETCVYCHGAPKQDPGDIGMGLNPKAPYLPETVGRWNSAQLFWIIKNGVKMTGMASYGASRNDDEIWTLVAFIQTLPKMTPQQYKQMEQEVAAHAQ
jgi:mono/diheme cytochrome c family protein